MQKPEWFKLDAAKFLADAQVDAMSTLELGACFRLLCRQWIDGSIPDDLRLLARLCHLDQEAMGHAWVTLAPFFPTIETGKRANRFMWMEREKVITALLRKSDEGTRAARKRWDDSINGLDATPNGSPIGHPMQDQTRPEQSRPEKISSSEQSRSDVAILPSKKPNPGPAREANKLATLLKSEILRNRSSAKITQAQERSWAATADRMLRLDGRDPAEAAELIRWAQKDEFWMRNVLSMEKFREKFDRLALEAKAKSSTTRKTTTPASLPDDYISPSKRLVGIQ